MTLTAALFQSKTTTQAAVLVAILSLGVVLVYHNLWGSKALDRFPMNGSQHGGYHKRILAFLYHAESLYRKGYSQFQGKFYRIFTTDGERLMIPNIYMDELKSLPEEEINNEKVLVTAIESKYTGIPAETRFLNHMVRADLTRSLPRINPRLSAEVDKTVHLELPQSKDWTPVVIHKKLLRMVAIVSGNIFLGPELCRREEYIHASINYALDLFAAVRALKMWPRILRPVVRYFIPQLKRLNDHKEKAKRFLLPIIEERRELMRQGKELPDDMLQWMLGKSDKFDVQDDSEMAFYQLSLSLAAIHTTSMTVTQALYDIIAHPDIIEDLRQEIQSVLKESDGVMTTNALFRMKLLDSVMRESQRINPSSMTRFSRYVDKHITLSDGTKLPAGVVIEAPHLAIARDAELYPNPDTFDPHRFARLRNGDVKDPIGYSSPEQYQFVSVAKENLSFGFGRHACPGRFFAANEIKLILARLLLDFDMKMPEGEAGRYANIILAGSIVPDTKKEILLRRRSATEN